MPGSLRWTTVSFHVSAVIFFLCGLSLFVFDATFPGSDGATLAAKVILGVLGLGFIVLAFGVEVLVSRLKTARKWAWFVGLLLAILYAVSLFLPLGVFGLIGLLSERTRRYCGVTV